MAVQVQVDAVVNVADSLKQLQAKVKSQKLVVSPQIDTSNINKGLKTINEAASNGLSSSLQQAMTQEAPRLMEEAKQNGTALQSLFGKVDFVKNIRGLQTTNGMGLKQRKQYKDTMLKKTTKVLSAGKCGIRFRQDWNRTE